MRFFIDECLSPVLAVRLNERGIDAYHPLHRGQRGDPDHVVLACCVAEDRIIVTENARDFRALLGREAMHPGLIVFPSIDREGTWRLMETVLSYLRLEADPRDYMFNRVLEVDAEGTIRSYRLPSSD